LTLFLPKFVGGVALSFPQDFSDPNAYWVRRFGRADVQVVSTPNGIWGPDHCQGC
jgi:hypothetical protein